MNASAAGKRPACELTRARILLKVDEGPDGPAWTDKRTADALEVAEGTVQSLRERFCERGSEGTVECKSPDREYYYKLDGEQEAELIRLAYSEALEGRSEWSLRLLADRLVELGIVESISHEAVRQTLKKRTEAPSEASMVIPPEQSAQFVAKMEDVLSAYKRSARPSMEGWLNMAEIEQSVLANQCLSPRIPSIAKMRRQTRAWAERRNKEEGTVNWRFRTDGDLEPRMRELG